MSTLPGTKRRARGEIERLPSGSLRVRVYDGLDPVSKKRKYLVATVTAGPTAEREAAEIRDRLVAEAARRRGSRNVDPVGPRASTGAAGDVEPVAGSGSRPRRGRRRGELTVAGVAQIAGVSAPTVSKVLNGRA